MSGTSMLSGEAASARATLRRGVELSPELVQGLGLTIFLAFIATIGRVLVPIAVQQGVDRGIGVEGGPTDASWRSWWRPPRSVSSSPERRPRS